MSIDIPEATNEEEQHTESIYENNPLLEIYEKNKGKVQKPQVIERPNSTLSSPKTVILDGVSDNTGADYQKSGFETPQNYQNTREGTIIQRVRKDSMDGSQMSNSDVMQIIEDEDED